MLAFFTGDRGRDEFPLCKNILLLYVGHEPLSCGVITAIHRKIRSPRYAS